MAGYWYTYNEEIIEVPSGITHMQFVCDNPSLLGLTEAQISEFEELFSVTLKELKNMHYFKYEDCDEYDYLIKEVLNKGNIRLRSNETEKVWYITYNYKKSKDNVFSFLMDMRHTLGNNKLFFYDEASDAVSTFVSWQSALARFSESSKKEKYKKIYESNNPE